ncbi:serine/threonine-protein kinase [Streptosporangium sp. G11]|uniref:serine/threonine-protein kinase n=1 Tax=Streptosporangium sp. G11 TaxID=3436926 RepID=UPI003EBA88D2
MPEDPSHVPEDPSRVLAGRYRLLAPLGEGGMGVVWRARDELLHQTVAVKEVTLPARLTAEDRERRLRRTLREARTAATLRGRPGVVTVYDVVEEDGRPWIVMELVEGPSLAEVIRREGPPTEARVAGIGLRVISALAAAEAAGIVHRDVKPANILLGSDGAVLTDFGIAAAVHDTTDLTGTGQLLGTIPYLAPEQLGGERASAASDLWATGVTLYEAVEGRRPFDRESPVATIAAIVNRPPAPTRYADRLLPVIEGLLRKDPAERLTALQATALLAPVAAEAPREHPRPGRAPGSTGFPGNPGFTGPAHDPRSTGLVRDPESTGPVRDPSSAALPGNPDSTGPAGKHVTDPAPLDGRVPTGGARRAPVRMAVVAGSALVAVAVAAAVIWWPHNDLSQQGSSRTPAPGGSAAASAASGGSSTGSGGGPTASSTPAGSPTASGDTGQDPTASPGQNLSASPGRNPPPSPGENPLPRGFALHSDPRGFSIAVPQGWKKEESERQVSWQRPRDSILSPSSWYLGTFANPERKETRDPAAILDQLRDALRDEMFASGSYQEFARRPVSVAGGKGAELEFGFAHKDASGIPHRLYARCVTRDSGGTGMFWFFTPAGQWAEAGGHVDTFVDTFRLN